MSSKVCFVTMMNISAVPYLSKYTALLNSNYDIIYWNRYGIAESTNATNQYPLDYLVERNATRAKKLIGYLRFKHFASNILRKNNYKKVVLLSGNVAVLLKNVLLSKYRNNYIIDIRDYFMESNRAYYKAEEHLIKNAGLAVISSEAYKTFLPPHKYIVVHNSPNIPNEKLTSFFEAQTARKSNRKRYEPITLSYIGGVRFLEQDKKVLRYFANDSRYLIRYIGAGANLLDSYCKENRIGNVYLHDRFQPEQTLDFYADTDILLNLYGSGTPLLDYALSNKLYYAATLNIPILVCPGTYMEQVSHEYGFGFSIDLNDPSCCDRLYSWYSAINMDELYGGCAKFMETVRQDEAIFREKVKKWCDIEKKQQTHLGRRVGYRGIGKY